MIVTKLQWADLERLRARSAAHPARWHTRGPLLLTKDDNGLDVELAMFRGLDGSNLAALVAEEHNRLVEIINIIVMLGRKLQDAQRSRAAVAAGADQGRGRGAG